MAKIIEFPGRRRSPSAHDLSDPLVRYMIKKKIPLTRERYLRLAYCIDSMPEEWGAEMESTLPEFFQDWTQFQPLPRKRTR